MFRMILSRGLTVVALLSVCSAGCGDGSSGADSSKSKKTPVTVDGSPIAEIDPERGRTVYASVCVTCHGQRGQGMPNQGVQLRKSKFVAEKSDNDIFEYLKVGRKADAPDSISGILMPPRGGNNALDDAQLKDVVAFLRVLQQEENQQ